MKKTMIGLFSATLMGAGLVGVTAGAAEAACPYTGCIDTFTHISAPDTVTQHDRARICTTVTTGGEGQPKGRVTLVVKRSAGDYHYTDSKRYDGRTCFTTTRLHRRGKYVVVMNFDRKAGSAFNDSDNTDRFRVVR